jgi:hypothetical protein
MQNGWLKFLIAIIVLIVLIDPSPKQIKGFFKPVYNFFEPNDVPPGDDDQALDSIHQNQIDFDSAQIIQSLDSLNDAK